MQNSRETGTMSNQASVPPLRKYCGLTDSRTPPQFVREFTMSTLYTDDDDMNDIRNFLASLGDQFLIYLPVFHELESFDEVKTYFLKLTWTDAAKKEELQTIKDEEFDTNSQESWEKYLIQTYIRLQDCKANDEEFQKIMIHKLFQVGKSDLPVNNFVKVRGKSSTSLMTQRVASRDLKWFAEIVYAQSTKELKNQPKLQPGNGKAEAND